MKSQRWVEVLAGALVLGVAAAFLILALVQGGRGPMGPGISLTAAFDRVDGLARGSEVRMSGVPVGTVTNLELDPRSFLAVVTMRLRADVALPRDSSAEIQSEGLLGGRFVALVPGGADEVLADGGRILETQGAINIESLLGRFIFSGGGAAGASEP